MALSRARAMHFVRCRTVLLRAQVLLDKMAEAAATNRRDSEHVVLTLDQSHRETVNGEDVLALQGHRVIATEHILIPQHVGENGRQSVSHFRLLYHRDGAEQGLQSKKLAVVK